MPNPIETARIAGAVNVLRPDWPVSSLATLIRTKHAARPARDVAVALAYVATDPATKTPARINESGPWWASATTSDITTGPWDRRACRRCRFPEHGEDPCQRRDPAAAERGATEARAAIRRTDPSEVA